MRRPGVILLAATLALGSGAAAKSVLAKSAKSEKSGKKSAGKAAAPPSAELAKLKSIKLGDPKAGLFAWGMSPNEVAEKAEGAVTARYRERADAAKADPGKQQRIRDELEKEKVTLRKSFTKFEGQKTGWDVSIIGPEFAQNNGESVVMLKEDIWTRYFFFFEDRLYKMFLAFNKDVIGDKSFRDFGKEMADKYGAPREVYRDEKVHGGLKRVLDHFEWAVSGEDSLKLVDRSEFYGVYCLVISDARVVDSVIAKRKITNPGTTEKDSLVESVLGSKDTGRDNNDDIIDRLTGKEVTKPGDEKKHGDILVPSTSAPTPEEISGSSGAATKAQKEKAQKEKKEKASNKGLAKEKAPESGGGLEL
jgi:hypothetical protein